MSRFSQKPTNGKLTVSKTVNSVCMPKSDVWVVRAAETGRFTGMSHNTEKVSAVIIPGYKTRG